MNINYNIKEYLSIFGRYCVNKFHFITNFIIFIYYIFKATITKPIYTNQMINQMINIGYNSIPVVAISSISSGAVLALQVYTGMSSSGLNVDAYFSQVVMLSIIREIGPVTTALMVSGRISSSIAAEIGTMKVSDQINAIFMLNTDPIKYLITPRIIAGLAMLPLLVIISDVISILGAYIVSVHKLGVSNGIFLNSLDHIRFIDFFSSFIKSISFGLIITFAGCIFGFYADGGSSGVGKAAINAVVSSCILILIANYFITDMFMR